VDRSKRRWRRQANTDDIQRSSAAWAGKGVQRRHLSDAATTYPGGDISRTHGETSQDLVSEQTRQGQATLRLPSTTSYSDVWRLSVNNDR